MAASRSLLLGVVVLTATLFAVSAYAQTSRTGQERRGSNAEERARGGEETPLLFPDAIRVEPGHKVSPRLSRPLGQMVEALNDGEAAKALELAEAAIANERASAYDKAFAAQVAANAAMDLDDLPGSIAYQKQAVDLNALNNEAHYSVMYSMAINQLNNEQVKDAIATLSVLIDETKTRNADIHYALAQTLAQDEQYPAAIEALKHALSLVPEPKADWLRLLQVAYMEAEQPAEAAAIGEKLLVMFPDDKRQIFALASSYLDFEQQEKAVALLEGARTRGLFTESRDYQTLYSLYFNIDAREKDVIAVIDEGLSKNILKRDLQTLNALAQAAYFSEDMPKAIATYKEAAVLDPKGETGLNLAKVLSAEAEDAQARDAAKAALAKGVAKPGEAWMVIARSESQLDNAAAMRVALQEAAKYPETRDQANRMLQQNR